MSDDDSAQRDAPAEKGEWPPWAAGYLAAIREVPNLTRAAERAGIARSTALRLGQRDESFALAVHDAREEALDLLEQQIYARATAGTPIRKTVTKTDKEGKVETTITEELHVSDVLAMFYLKRWRPEYRESYTVEHGGAARPIQVRVERERTPERLEELLRIAAETGLLEAAGLKVVPLEE